MNACLNPTNDREDFGINDMELGHDKNNSNLKLIPKEGAGIWRRSRERQ
jgi:hypothetical protein